MNSTKTKIDKAGVDHSDKPYKPYWYIHGRLYDLEPWLEKHPGGADFLHRCRGTYCTAAFEVHHIRMPKALTMLKQFEVKVSEPPVTSPWPQFNWSQYGQLRKQLAKRLKHCKVKRHHHIRQDNKGDLQRLAREINGESIALVLGGGGARSFAQIGVIKAMEELSIPIDKVAGTSMGAIIAAQYADGYSPEQMLALNEEIWLRQKPHKDFTLPVSSLLSAHRAKQQTCGVFAQRHIEDLWLDFFCISTDLTELKPYHHRQGLVWSALLASGAIPGVCSSIVSDEGSLLVDGGILDNLPVAAMREHHKGPVIAVDISSDKGLKPGVTDTIPPNGWQALWQYLNPFAKKRRFPHIFKLISHTATLTGKVNAHTSRKLADLCLTPDCRGHGLMEMKRIDQLVERGYREAIPKLQQWLESSNRTETN